MAKSTDTGCKNLLGFMHKASYEDVPGYVPTGHFVLDFALVHGIDPTQKDLSKMPDYDPEKRLGLPLGRIVEFFGEEGGGKSSLAYRVCGNAQKLGLPVAWIDAEHSFSPGLAELNGCDVTDMWMTSLTDAKDPEKVLCAEEVFSLMMDMCKAKDLQGGPPPKVIVLDSVAALVPKAYYEASSTQEFMAGLSRTVSPKIAPLMQYASTHGVLIIMINQIREKLGIMWGNPETTPGGHGLKHAFSVRLQLTRKKNKESLIMLQDDDGNEVMIGGHATARIAKNKIARPFFGQMEIPIYYEPYFPEIEDIAFDTGRQLKLISVYKGEFRWGDVRVSGRKEFIEHIRENQLVNALLDEVKTAAQEQNVILPPEIVLYTIKNDDEISEEENADNVETEVSSTGKTENRRGRPRKSQKE